MDIDDQHDQQGQQHTAEKIEIDHVVHGYHSFKQALSQAFGAAVDAGGGSGVQTCTTEPEVTYSQFYLLLMSNKYFLLN